MGSGLKYGIIAFFLVAIAGILIYKFTGKNRNLPNPNPRFTVGQALDSFNGVKVYYNGAIGHVAERNTSDDGYNIGLKYQCVEFVKRYYYEFYHHKMKNSYGHAFSFFDTNTTDGHLNKDRGLLQYANPSRKSPEVGDIVIFCGTKGNPYGHVAIVSKVSQNKIEIIQQNPGPFAPPRVTIPLNKIMGKWKLENKRVLGWLHKKNTVAISATR